MCYSYSVIVFHSDGNCRAVTNAKHLLGVEAWASSELTALHAAMCFLALQLPMCWPVLTAKVDSSHIVFQIEHGRPYSVRVPLTEVLPLLSRPTAQNTVVQYLNGKSTFGRTAVAIRDLPTNLCDG
jgi:hypothetical protein